MGFETLAIRRSEIALLTVSAQKLLSTQCSNSSPFLAVPYGRREHTSKSQPKWQNINIISGKNFKENSWYFWMTQGWTLLICGVALFLWVFFFCQTCFPQRLPYLLKLVMWLSFCGVIFPFSGWMLIRWHNANMKRERGSLDKQVVHVQGLASP